MLEVAAGPGLHRLERSGDDRWRWTAGPRPWYVPLADGRDDAKILVNGRAAPPGRVVRLLNSAGAFLDTRGYAGDIGADSNDDGRFDEPGERFAVSGAAFVTRRETWRRLGTFARRYFAYYEDVDWCWRAHLAGMRVWYDPAATVQHRRSASSGGEREPWVRVMAERNRTLSMVRNGPSRLVLKALRDRVSNGPDGGVRAGIAALLPWALAGRARQAPRWAVRPEEVWERWAGWEP
jgi:GT2 family glycosyltransferase